MSERTIRPLIGLRGRKGSGKDTVAGFLSELADYHLAALADPLKRQHYDMLVHAYSMSSRDPLPPVLRSFSAYLSYCEAHKHDPPEAPTAWPRHAWQAHGSAMRDLCGHDYWLRQASLLPGYVVKDVRHPNEMAAVHDAGGFVWLIVRPGVDTSDVHESERYADDLSLPYDQLVCNGGTLDDLRASVATCYGLTCRASLRCAG